MTGEQRKSKPLALEPLDEAGPAGAEGGTTANDRFMAQAERELADGILSQRLWVRIAAQAGADKDAAKSAYLRARATELRLAKRGELPQPPVDAPALLPETTVGAMARAAKPVAAKPGGPAASRIGSRRVHYAAGAVAVAVVLGVAIVATRSGGDSASPPSSVAGTKPQVAQTSKAPTTPPAAAPRDDAQGPSLEAKVQELREAGNWNVLVLYASEWTRKQPSNPAAWRQLSVGYVNLRQLDEAFHAAKKATELAPQDASLWRNLALVNAAANDPAAALAAFERAAALDEHDVYTLVQIGVLRAQLDRLPEARAALDRALAASPQNVEALCAQMSVAQKQGRAKDADALAKELAALDGRCRDATERASAVPPPRAPASPPRAPASPTSPATARGR